MRPTLVLAIALVATACTGGSASEPPGTLIGSESFDAAIPLLRMCLQATSIHVQKPSSQACWSE
jgi:hypothetical protein